MEKKVLKKFKTTEILGSKVAMVQIPEVVEIMSDWIEKKPKKCHWIIFTGMHGIVESYKRKDFKKILNSPDLFVPDGISLIWLARNKGFNLKKRVSAGSFMDEFFIEAQDKGYSNFFYGDTDKTLNELKNKLLEKFPNLKISGMYSPPFRELTQRENEEIIKKINDSKSDVLWVGLGLPKQERWIFYNKNKLNVSAIIGVGAAFKFLSGRIKRAPDWVGDLGFEWFWRLIHEPKRVWKRIFFDGPIFLYLVFLDLFFDNSKSQ